MSHGDDVIKMNFKEAHQKIKTEQISEMVSFFLDLSSKLLNLYWPKC